MRQRVKEVKYIGTKYVEKEATFYFTYKIDSQSYVIDLRHSIPSELPVETIEKIGFNIGMCYLMDLAEVVLPRQISIYKKLPDLAFSYWKALYEELVIEKCYAMQLHTSSKNVIWEMGDELIDLELPALPKRSRDHAALGLTGGKESLAVLKTLEKKKPLLLFFLNPETNVHRQRVYETVKDDFLTIRTFSNQHAIIAELEKEHGLLASGVDMAHIVFNTMLYADKCEYILIGNEYSSNYPNDVYEGVVVNHQFVKTIHFAENINNYIHNFVTKDYSYHSPFFGMYEFLIADLFFQNERYLDIWTSCNQTTPEVNFCSNCAKCAFTYLLARTKKSEKYLSKFFSRDMLESVPLYKPLMDFTGVKPLDCVGDKKEVWVCLEILRSKGEKNAVIEYYEQQIRPQIIHELDDFKHQISSIHRTAIETPKELETIFERALAATKNK